MQVTVQIPLDGTFRNLNELVQSKLIADDKAPIRTWAHNVYIRNDNTDPSLAASRVEITNDPVSAVPFERLLPEADKDFKSGGLNRESLLDKFVRLMDNDGVTPLTGTCVVRIDVA